ncbi:TIGR04211 family SH3 domain-containing protein [Methylophaga sp. OBS4]|uniref:TIGR04211 family SH3 domain-containing protein n=1 Tax=Methylophaga sp. OBS4 TaxID=2991935 RepID=UPI002258F173|nr:TIGR04211 family SH3 domain-containing protein [Methylophaga sp. OBS4]MCX4186361.1 TIGR04211 family SH3 domain-containing protein [Methylophaga sp. OBS4]
MKKFITNFLITVVLLVPVFASAQTTRYVSDELEITMRNGQGVKFGIRKMLTSGTRLDVLETDPAGYSKVRTAEGIEGWVLTRYLSNTPSARDRLTASEQKIANLELEISRYKEEISALSSQNTDVDSQNMTLKEKSQRLSKELDDLRRTASNAVALDNENRQLKEKLQQIDHQNQSLVIENNALKDNSTRNWFLIGAAVLFAGIVLGLILPRLRLRKKDSWGSL